MRRLMDEIESLAPLGLAVEGDNCGLIVGRGDMEITSVLLALGADMAVIEECIEEGISCIVTHHPFILEPMRRINDSTDAGRRALKAIEAKIPIYSAHTNLDSCSGGVGDRLCEILEVDVEDVVSYGNCPMGRIGHFKHEFTLEQAAERVKKILKLPAVRFCGDNNAPVKRVGVLGGSGMGYLEPFIRLGCDTVLTGDMKLGNASEAVSRGIKLIDITHYGSEVIVLPFLKDYLEKRLDIPVFLSKRDRDIFTYL